MNYFLRFSFTVCLFLSFFRVFVCVLPFFSSVLVVSVFVCVWPSRQVSRQDGKNLAPGFCLLDVLLTVFVGRNLASGGDGDGFLVRITIGVVVDFGDGPCGHTCPEMV